MGTQRRRETPAWTEAGAARSAHRARARTVEHLRTASINGIYAAMRFREMRQAMIDNGVAPAAATAMIYTHLGHRPNHRDHDLEGLGRLVVADEAQRLADAELYVVAPQMADVLVAAGNSLSDEDLALCTSDDVPTPTGCVLLPQSLFVENQLDRPGDMVALVWGSPTTRRQYDPRHQRLVDVTGIPISTYADRDNSVPNPSRDVTRRVAAEFGQDLPPLLFTSTGMLPLHVSSEEAARELGLTWDETNARLLANERARLGHDFGEATGEHIAGDRIADPTGSFDNRLLFALWRLCEQRIGRTTKPPAVRRRGTPAEREEPWRDVNIIHLRRVEEAPRPGAAFSGSVQWKKRWVVGMHKVNQWFPAEGRHKPMWRGPYVKGPGHLPLSTTPRTRSLRQ